MQEAQPLLSVPNHPFVLQKVRHLNTHSCVQQKWQIAPLLWFNFNSDVSVASPSTFLYRSHSRSDASHLVYGLKCVGHLFFNFYFACSMLQVWAYRVQGSVCSSICAEFYPQSHDTTHLPPIQSHA